MLNKILKGTLLISPNIQKLASSLMQHRVPEVWSTRWEGPEEPYLYLRSLVAKSLALNGWSEKCRQRQLLDEPLDLSDLLNPGTFLNAVRQETAR